jgi:hypothetical protein
VLVVSWIIVSESALDKLEEGSEEAVTMVATFCFRQSRLSQEQPPGPAAQLATSMRGGQSDPLWDGAKSCICWLGEGKESIRHESVSGVWCDVTHVGPG